MPELCAHHWELEPLSAAESVGVCKLCGETRVFSNREQVGPKPGWQYNRKVKT